MACNFMLSCQLVALWISKHGQQLNETLKNTLKETLYETLR